MGILEKQANEDYKNGIEHDYIFDIQNNTSHVQVVAKDIKQALEIAEQTLKNITNINIIGYCKDNKEVKEYPYDIKVVESSTMQLLKGCRCETLAELQKRYNHYTGTLINGKQEIILSMYDELVEEHREIDFNGLLCGADIKVINGKVERTYGNE